MIQHKSDYLGSRFTITPKAWDTKPFNYPPPRKEERRVGRNTKVIDFTKCQPTPKTNYPIWNETPIRSTASATTLF